MSPGDIVEVLLRADGPVDIEALFEASMHLRREHHQRGAPGLRGPRSLAAAAQRDPQHCPKRVLDSDADLEQYFRQFVSSYIPTHTLTVSVKTATRVVS